ncbi:MAG: single-stranded-DNA-specific exonuclease RecJ [Endomicrobium sp.]|jgi:single-stranded-DNA-specific exonuclease|nr:single-stranded-DNA-specific exonuclease RecJ [Endomicrobium sp.]
MRDKEKKWKIIKEDREKSSAISCSPLISKIASMLVNRGIDTIEKTEIFINGGIESLHNPFLFADMQKAVDKIRKVIDLDETILVYGDRDVDGVTAVNIIVNTIKFLGGNVQWYVPANEGYGIHRSILSKYATESIKILITVDCGISATKEIAYAKTLGMDVILTDHHEPPYEGIPSAEAIINPKICGSRYPFKDIAGCVVSLKIMQALMLTFDEEYNKEIILCHGIKNNRDYCGNCIYLKNDLEVKKTSFKSISEINKITEKAFKIYTNNINIKNILLKSNNLIKDKIIVLESNQVNDIEDFLKIYKIKKTNENQRMKDFFEKNLDLCALGTIADSMPLIDENRIIVKEGLKIIKNHPNAKPGLGLLIEDALTSKGVQNITAKTISWNITPVLNSSGRMSRGVLSAQLLMTKDTYQAKNLYTDILKLNEDRKWLQSENIECFRQLLRKQCDVENDKVLIVKASNLEHGVTGIIASQMVKTYSKPAFLFITDGKEAIGAARTIEDFDVVAALESVKDILIKYGGHCQAAGFVLKHSKIDEFTRRILEYVNKNLVKKNHSNTLIIESELKISDISLDLYKQIEMMEPFGIGNLRPVFCIRGVIPTEISIFGNHDEHLRFKISQKGSKNIQAVFWNKSKFARIIRSENSLDIAFNIDITCKNKILQLNVIDMKPTYQ